MIPAEVKAVLDQAKQNNDLLKSMELHYDALATLIGQLNATISGLQAGSVLSDTDKAALAAQASDLANTAAAATSDITKNTPLESGLAPAPAPAPASVAAPAPADVAPPSAPVDTAPAAPTT